MSLKKSAKLVHPHFVIEMNVSVKVINYPEVSFDFYDLNADSPSTKSVFHMFGWQIEKARA